MFYLYFFESNDINCKTIDKSDSFVCSSCMFGKYVKLPFENSMSQSKECFELIHFDVWQSPVILVSGFRYYIIFIDDFSRYTWVYPLKFKYEVFDKFVEFKAIVENIFASKIKHFQSDGGKEFVNSSFSKLFASNGIMHRISCPHTPK
jgi:Integrase core domain